MGSRESVRGGSDATYPYEGLITENSEINFLDYFHASYALRCSCDELSLDVSKRLFSGNSKKNSKLVTTGRYHDLSLGDRYHEGDKWAKDTAHAQFV